MAKNGKKSFLDFFKVDESSDEYEDDLEKARIIKY